MDHKCLKCFVKYEDDDEDDYYCPPCLKTRNKLAEEIDRKLASTISKRQAKSDYQIYEEVRRANGGRPPSLEQLNNFK